MAQRKARIGRNPKTGEEITIAETMAPRFRAGQALKSALAKINQQ
jgi:DNA-binding protein HU-beta